VITLRDLISCGRPWSTSTGKTVPYQRESNRNAHLLDANASAIPGKFDIVVKNPGPGATSGNGETAPPMAHLLVNFKY